MDNGSTPKLFSFSNICKLEEGGMASQNIVLKK